MDDPLSKAGEEGGIQAAPIIAVIGGYTAAATTESSTSLTASTSSQQPKISPCDTRGRGTIEEEELSKLLARIQEFDREEFEEELDTNHFLEHDDEDDEPSVVMAEFDLLLDDSSILSEEQSTKYGEDATKHRASSMHAITELYISANKVYRLHEEHRKMRASEARLRLGKKAAASAAAYEIVW